MKKGFLEQVLGATNLEVGQGELLQWGYVPQVLDNCQKPKSFAWDPCKVGLLITGTTSYSTESTSILHLHCMGFVFKNSRSVVLVDLNPFQNCGFANPTPRPRKSNNKEFIFLYLTYDDMSITHVRDNISIILGCRSSAFQCNYMLIVIISSFKLNIVIEH